MIQDIKPHIFHNEYVIKQPDVDDYIMVFKDNKILMKKEKTGMFFPRKMELERYLRALCDRVEHTYQYLFCIDRDNYFLYMDFCNSGNSTENCNTKMDEKEINQNPENMIIAEEINFSYQKMMDVRQKASREVCFAAYTACHLYHWYQDNQFCGRCGERVRPDTEERMLYCAQCGNQIYPKIAPAVIVAVTDGDRILLSRYADREYTKYALIAGFTEIGETAEETVRREVMEETGLRVKNIRYYKTQPWGIAANLLIGYFADLEGNDEIRFDRKELAEARWMYREELTGMDDGFSLTREMMRVFCEGREPL